MNWRSWFSKQSSGTGGSTKLEECVTLHIDLSGEDFGTWAERTSIHHFTDRLAAVIDANGLGEYDGDVFGDGESVLYMYGPSADRLFDAILPIVRESSVTISHAILRYGTPGAPSKKIQLD